MALFSPSASVLVLLPPGMGSTSVQAALTAGESADGTGFKNLGSKHSTFDESLAELERTGFVGSNLQVWCLTRNPYALERAEWWRCRTKWVSALARRDSWIADDRSKVREVVEACRMSFSEWVRWKLGDLVESGCRSNFLERYPISGVDRWLYQESLAVDFADAIATVDLEHVELPVTNTSVYEAMAPYWQDFDRKARSLAEFYFQPEIDFFEYRF